MIVDKCVAVQLAVHNKHFMSVCDLYITCLTQVIRDSQAQRRKRVCKYM